jgi:hypothetical protein
MKLFLTRGELVRFTVALILSEAMFAIVGSPWYGYLFPVGFYVLLLVGTNAAAKRDPQRRPRGDR